MTGGRGVGGGATAGLRGVALLLRLARFATQDSLRHAAACHQSLLSALTTTQEA